MDDVSVLREACKHVLHALLQSINLRHRIWMNMWTQDAKAKCILLIVFPINPSSATVSFDSQYKSRCSHGLLWGCWSALMGYIGCMIFLKVKWGGSTKSILSCNFTYFPKIFGFQFDQVWCWNMLLQSHNWIKEWFTLSNGGEFMVGVFGSCKWNLLAMAIIIK